MRRPSRSRQVWCIIGACAGAWVRTDTKAIDTVSGHFGSHAAVRSAVQAMADAGRTRVADGKTVADFSLQNSGRSVRRLPPARACTAICPQEDGATRVHGFRIAARAAPGQRGSMPSVFGGKFKRVTAENCRCAGAAR